MKPIYLDFQATTPVHASVVEKMTPFWSSEFGNPHSSEHIAGWTANATLNRCRDNVAALVGAFPEDVIFTSGATEANNLALLGHRASFPARGGVSVLYAATEHKCVINASKTLASEIGLEAIALPVDKQGSLDFDVLERELKKGPAIVSVMLVNNEIGTIQDLKKIRQICSKFDALLHCDASQAPSFMDITWLADSADSISLSSHKMYGPMGIGALIASPEIQRQLKPLAVGGGQEAGIRSGTVPLPLCAGFSEACKLVMTSEYAAQINQASELRNHFFEALNCSSLNVQLNGPTFSNRHLCNLNLCFPETNAKAVLDTLQPNLCASSGAACSSGVEGPSETLTAIGLSLEQANASVRFSFGLSNTEEQVQRAVELVCRAVTANC